LKEKWQKRQRERIFFFFIARAVSLIARSVSLIAKKFFLVFSFYQKIRKELKMTARLNGIELPILQSTKHVNEWKRRFRDYCSGNQLWGIMSGTDQGPTQLSIHNCRRT